MVNGHIVNSDVPVNAVFTDTTYSDATTSAHGLMSPSDKSKLEDVYKRQDDRLLRGQNKCIRYLMK